MIHIIMSTSSPPPKSIMTIIIIIAILVVISLIVGGIKKMFDNIKRGIKRKVRREISNLSKDLIGLSLSDVKDVTSAIKEVAKEAEETPQPKSISGATTIYLPRIEKDFPDFHLNDAELAVKTFVTEYIKIVYGGAKDFATANVHEALISQIEKMGNNVSAINIHNLAIANYKKTSDYATITFQVSVGFMYQGKMVETKYDVEYSLRLCKDNIATEAMTCPNCGAPITDTSQTNCKYCDIKIIKDTILNWEFTSIKER